MAYRVIYPDGNPRTNRVYEGKAMFNESGVPVREIGIIMDITERRISEDTLKESQQFLQHLAETTLDAIYILDQQKDQIVYANQGMFLVLGYTKEDILKQSSAFFTSITHANDRERRADYDRSFIRAKDDDIREIECQLKHANGHWRWFLIRSRVFRRSNDGTPCQILGIAQDITQRKNAENDLRALNEDLEKRVRVRTLQMEESVERFRSLLEAMPQMAWAVLQDGSVEYFNQRWFDYTGQTPEHAKNEGWQSSLHPDDFAESELSWAKSLQTGQSYQVEYRFRRASDGSYRWHLVRAEPVRNKKGKVNLWVGTCTDIHDLRVAIQNMDNTQEELKNTNEELSEKNEELSRINVDLDNFMYSASHDLRSPVSNLEGLLALLTSELDGRLNATEVAFIEMINTSLTKLKQTINDLTEITKIQKELSEEVEPLSFDDLLEDVKADIGKMIVESEAKITTDFQVPIIHFTRKNLRSLFYNLVSNAIKYRSGDRSPQVHITTQYHDGNLLLSVRDNGLGIRNDQIDKIFLMFKRAHTHVEGTGVGLYIVKRIIENTGGKIEVKSELGEGTTFYVYFKIKLQPL